jgi:hypothetical protein
MIICVPGPWEDRSDFARRVFSLEPSGRYTFAGGILADVEHQDQVTVQFLGRHPRMLEAFEAATRGDLPPDVASAITSHRSTIYLRFRSNLVEERLRILKFTTLAKRLGGMAIKLESSGVGHWWERWFQLLGSKNEFDWYCAVVMLLAEDSRYYSCGMHHFGLPDSAVEKRLVIREAANLINKFNYWRIINQPTLRSAELLRLDESGARFRLLWEPDRLNPEGDLFHNPYGIWLLVELVERGVVKEVTEGEFHHRDTEDAK